MWTVLFGEQDAAAADYDEQPPPPPPSAERKPAVPPSPASTAPMTPSPPGSSSGQPRRPATPPALPVAPSSGGEAAGLRRPSVQLDNDEDDSPMAMLLKRMNRLMVKVGEHEFEKKTLVDGVR